MRQIKLTSVRALRLLAEKKDLSKRMLAITEEMTALEEESNKLIAKLARIDDRSRPLIIKEYEKAEVGEFEQISSVKQEGEDWFINIADRMEEFKAQFKK